MEATIKANQCNRILAYLQEQGSITSKEAYERLAIYDLPKRISELKKLGWDIRDKWETFENNYCKGKAKRYWIQPADVKEAV